MSTDNFVDALGLPLLAHRLRRASDVIIREVVELLRGRGVPVPPRAASLVMLLAAEGDMSVVTAAKRLGLSHPMVINLSRAAAAAGLIEDRSDPADNRRRLLHLTSRGSAQMAFLLALNKALAETYRGMFAESGSDLFAALEGFELAATRRSVHDRVNALIGGVNPEEPPL